MSEFKPGWADQVAAAVIAEKTAPVPTTKRKSWRRDTARDYASGLAGSSKGGANKRYAARKLDAVLGPPDEG